MKKRMLCRFVLLLASPVFAQIAKQQSAATWNQTNTTTCVVPFGMATGLNNLIVVWTSWQSTSTFTALVTDSNNTYASAVGPTLQSAASTPTTAQIFYAKKIKNGNDTVTVTYSGTVSSANCVAVEYSGLDQNNPLDSGHAGFSYSPSNTLDSGATAPANASLLVFGGGTSDTGTAGTGSPWNLIQSNGGSITEYQILSSNSALLRATASLSGIVTGNWLMQMAVFRDASVGPTVGSRASTDASFVSNAGVFTNTQGNDYVLSQVGGCVSSSTFYGIQSPNYYTSAIDGCTTFPSSSTAVGGYGVMGMVNDASSTTQAAGAYFQGVGTGNNVQIEGLNVLSSCQGVLSGCKIVGIETDVSPSLPGSSGATPTSVHGLQMTGKNNGATVPGGFDASAVVIEPDSWSWHYGLVFSRAATDLTAIFLGGLMGTGSTASQAATWEGWASDGNMPPNYFNHDVQFQASATGAMNVTFATPTGGSATATPDFNIVGGLKIQDMGSCAMSSGACSAQPFGHTYVSAPLCFLTWNGLGGTLHGILSAPSTTSAVTPTSSVNTDTSQVNWMCLGS